MKTLQRILMFYFLSAICILQAQENERKGWDGTVKGGPTINVSYESTMPNSATKDAYITNSSGIRGDVFVPFLLFRKGWDGTVKGGNFGFNIGGTYNFGGNGDPSAALPPAFLIGGQTSSSVAYKGVDPRNPGFRIGGGPQVNFNFGERFIFSPMVLAEYFSMTQNELSAIQTSEINGKPKEYTLWTLPETKTTGLAITPKVRLQYLFTKNLGIFADGGYIFGPKINTQISSLVPVGNPNQGGQYEQQQLDLGTMVKGETITTNYNALAFNFGLSYIFGSNKVKSDNRKDVDSNPSTQINEDDIPKDPEMSPEIQKLITAQDQKLNKTFEYIGKTKNAMQSKCSFEIIKVDIECNGRDSSGNKKYHVVITYKNNSTTGAATLGHYSVACTPTTANGNYLQVSPMGSATISGLSPGTAALTPIPPGGTINITFDIVPTTSFASLNVQGNTINSGTSCGNCDDGITLNFPNCCDGCEENPVVAKAISTTQINAAAGTIKIVNSLSSPKNITKISADIVSVKYYPTNNDCLKCNDQIKNQNNFVNTNNISGFGWNNSGNPVTYLGGNSVPNTSRSLLFTSISASGVNLATPTNITHTVGVSPNSCCGDTVEIWIRYTLIDKDCHVCDKLVRSRITRKGTCADSSGGVGTTTQQIPTKL